jgi:hypothetical protein
LQFYHEDYPEEIKNFDYENHLQNEQLDCSVWDIQRGLILQLSDEKTITNAYLGWKSLSKSEIKEIYGNPAVFKALKWPKTTCFMDDE